MGYTLAQFSDSCHCILADDPGVEGRKKVCALVQEVLKDEPFLTAHLRDDGPERKILYEDPKLGCLSSAWATASLPPGESGGKP